MARGPLRPLVAAARLLGRAWWRAHRRWALATAAVIAIVCGGILAVEGLFDGIEGASARCVADFYTGDLRVTAGPPGAAPTGRFPDLNGTLSRMRAGGALAEERFESQVILSRRTLVEAYLEEQQQYEVVAPGATSGHNAYGVGLVAGLVPHGQAMERASAHLVGGRMPQPAGARIELAMGLRQFEHFLAPGERANMSRWPPAAADLALVRFEVTAGRIDDSHGYRDIVRFPAEVVGVFATDLDTLDSYTSLTDVGSARRLVGLAPAAPVANAVTVQSGAPAAARVAREQGLSSEDGRSFALRYLADVVLLLRALARAVSALLLILPTVLLWSGLQHLLDRERRELGVCRAIGVPRSVLRSGLGLLLARVLAAGLLGTALLAILLAAGGPPLLAHWHGLPVPGGFELSWRAAGEVLGLVATSTALASWGAARRLRREDLAALLRAP